MAAGKKRTVLVADDDPVTRSVLCHILESKGFFVHEATDGAEALELADAFPGRIHLLCTDFAMPNMNGVQLAAALTDDRPYIRTLYITRPREIGRASCRERVTM